MTLSILKRINILREDLGLSKSAFEKKISKSNGYLNGLEKREGQPGADVVVDIINAFPDYSLNWLMTGSGDMKIQKGKIASDEQEEYQLEHKTTLLDVRDDLKNDVHGVNENILALSRAYEKKSMESSSRRASSKS